MDDSPRAVPAPRRARGEEHRAGHAALLLRPRRAGAADRAAVRRLRFRRGFRRARADHHGAAPAQGNLGAQEIAGTAGGDAAAGPSALSMEFEYWWLLGFPLFFGLGWIAARIDIRHLLRESRALPSSYFKGLNFLMNGQPDKAIEAFIEVVKVDPETIELHFALGSLFRRRGEYDRAIRMHQNLLERAGLAADQKVIALAELGQDYLKAGILDRAEEVFKKLEGSPQANLARTHLLEIYEQEKDWKRAIEMTRQVDSDPRELAQYYCELATSEAAQSRPDVARGHLEAALKANRN